MTLLRPAYIPRVLASVWRHRDDVLGEKQTSSWTRSLFGSGPVWRACAVYGLVQPDRRVRRLSGLAWEGPTGIDMTSSVGTGEARP